MRNGYLSTGEFLVMRLEKPGIDECEAFRPLARESAYGALHPESLPELKGAMRVILAPSPG